MTARVWIALPVARAAEVNEERTDVIAIEVDQREEANDLFEAAEDLKVNRVNRIAARAARQAARATRKAARDTRRAAKSEVHRKFARLPLGDQIEGMFEKATISTVRYQLYVYEMENVRAEIAEIQAAIPTALVIGAFVNGALYSDEIGVIPVHAQAWRFMPDKVTYDELGVETSRVKARNNSDLTPVVVPYTFGGYNQVFS